MEQRRTVGFAIKAISNEFMRFIDNRLRGGEITGMQHGILRFITDNPDNAFQRDVEKEFNIRRSTATGILQLMEKNGLVRREQTENDARLKKIIITKKGNAAVEVAARDIWEIEGIITKGISDEDLDAFFRTLDKIMENIS